MTRPTVALRVEHTLAAISRKAWDACANPGWSTDADHELARSAPIPRTCRGVAEPPLLRRESNDEPAGSDIPVELPESESELQKPAYNPFVSYDFLQSLEESSCADAMTGWLPQHLVLDDSNGVPEAVVPCYLKNHSQGEYVFDYGWADAFHRAGGQYYPKLQVSVPFTPATGRRLLFRDTDRADELTPIMAEGLVELTRRHDASSIHLTFLEPDESRRLEKLGYLIRTDQQFHWLNDGYGTFDDFLAALASRKRKTIRRERRDALASGLAIEWLTGDAITEAHWDAFFEFYMDTGSRKWGSPYLNRHFFSLIGERMGDRILLMLARRAGRYIAGALNFIGSDTLYGRYWGCNEDHPFLHFELCYYQAIDFAIANGLQCVEAGAQGPHKLARGYVPVKTHSAHWIAHPGLRDAIADYLRHERVAVDHDQEALADHTPFRRDGSAGNL